MLRQQHLLKDAGSNWYLTVRNVLRVRSIRMRRMMTSSYERQPRWRGRRNCRTIRALRVECGKGCKGGGLYPISVHLRDTFVQFRAFWQVEPSGEAKLSTVITEYQSWKPITPCNVQK